MTPNKNSATPKILAFEVDGTSDNVVIQYPPPKPTDFKPSSVRALYAASSSILIFFGNINHNPIPDKINPKANNMALRNNEGLN